MLSLKNANGGNVLLLTTSASNTLRSHLFLKKKCVHQKCYKFRRQDKVAQNVLSPLLHLFLTGQKEITTIHYCFPVHDMLNNLMMLFCLLFEIYCALPEFVDIHVHIFRNGINLYACKTDAQGCETVTCMS